MIFRFIFVLYWMDLSTLIPDIFPHQVAVGTVSLFQSLIAGLLGTSVFVILVLVYSHLKKRNPYNRFVQGVDLIVEWVYSMLAQIGGEHVGRKAILFTTTLFLFVVWHNLFGLIGDMIVLVWPAAHHVFRPLTTDIVSNGTLAVISIVASLAYGFASHGFGFIKKYLPINWMGIVKEVKHWYDYITKFLDIVLGLLIGIIELLGEFGRMLSLALRLFGNMFVWMILLTLLLYATQLLLHYPIVGPITIFAYEFAVSLLQAFIFALLTTIYFKLAADSH